MDALPPYVEAKDHLRVHAVVRGEPVAGVVLGWRGDRVYLTWRTDMGNHLGWVPASVVERRRAVRPTSPASAPATRATPS